MQVGVPVGGEQICTAAHICSPPRVSGSSRAKTYGSVLYAIFQLLAERLFTNGAGFLQ
jgi:hypothetical protein